MNAQGAGGVVEDGTRLKDHLGRELRPNVDLFLPPPAEIGRVISAASDVRVGKALWSVPKKMLASLGIALALFAIVAAVFPRKPDDPKGAPYALGAFVGILVATVGVTFSFKPRRLSYLGEEGVAIFTTRSSREAASREVVRFADVADVQLRKWATKRQAASTWMAFDLKLLNASGAALLHLKGEYTQSPLGKVPNHAFDFAEAVERKWGQIRP